MSAGPDVRVTAAGNAVAAFAIARVIPFSTAPVQMIATLRHQRVNMRVEILAVHPLVMGTGYQMPEMTYHAVGKKSLSVFVEVQPPWIRCSMGDNLEGLLDGMIAPNTAL